MDRNVHANAAVAKLCGGDLLAARSYHGEKQDGRCVPSRL